MLQVELSAGPIEYSDSGGPGPVVLLFGGLVIGPSLWRGVVADLARDHRCIVPTLPLGAHRLPVRSDFPISPRTVAMLLGEFLERLDLRAVTLVENDTGRAQTLAAERPERLARLVLTSSEAFDNYPPGIPGRMAAAIAKIPGGVEVLAWQLRFRALRRLPITFGWMSKRPVPHEVMDGWLRPLTTNAGVRRDLRRYIRAVDPREMEVAALGLRAFPYPALIVWAREDRVMPPEHGRRLAAIIPNARLVEVADSYTLIPEDQPLRLAAEIRNFIAETPRSHASSPG